MTKKWDNLDKAIIGTSLVWDSLGKQIERVVYDGKKIISILIEQDEMTYEQAIEHIDYNIQGAYIGKDTPVIVWKKSIEDI